MSGRCCLCLIAILSLTWNILASDTAGITVEEMAVQSNVIVTGVCVSSVSRWDESARTIMTDSVIQVDHYIKGSGPSSVRVTSLGGVLPQLNLAMSVSGMVEFKRGEEVLLFLKDAPGASYSVYGMARGKQLIQRDAAGTRRIKDQSLESFVGEIDRALQGRKRK